MSNIDDVTASFATSLALASGGEVIDITAMASGSQHQASQSYLLARLFTAKPAALSDLKRFFKRVWVIEKDFKIHEREPNRFVLSFDLIRDRNKVLKGGPWCFHHAPIVLREYDGVTPIRTVNLNSLYLWVRITDIPPLYGVHHTIKNIASVAGKYIELDEKLFDNSGKVRVRVLHGIDKPFFLKKTLKLDIGVEAEISFFFENLVGKCKACDLIFHENGRCPAADGQAVPWVEHGGQEKRPEIPMPSLGFTTWKFTNGTFKFLGLQTPVLPPVSRALFGSKDVSTGRKPILLRAQDTRSSSSRDNALALVFVENGSVEKLVLTKRDRSASQYSSPKNLMVLLLDLFTTPTCLDMPTKKLKMLEFTTKFFAKSLGMVEAPGSILVSKEAKQEVKSEPKKKRGRPLGSKNKKPSTTKKVEEAQALCFAYLTKPPSPSLKGKEKV